MVRFEDILIPTEEDVIKALRPVETEEVTRPVSIRGRRLGAAQAQSLDALGGRMEEEMRSRGIWSKDVHFKSKSTADKLREAARAVMERSDGDYDCPDDYVAPLAFYHLGKMRKNKSNRSQSPAPTQAPAPAPATSLVCPKMTALRSW